MTRLIFFLVIALTIISSCTPGSATLPPSTDTAIAITSSLTMTAKPSATSIPTITPSPTPTRIAPAVDTTTLEGKVVFGYQGWFSCIGDGAGYSNWNTTGTWIHWFQYYQEPVANSLTVDYWPDTSELTEDEKCLTKMNLPNGDPVVAYSSYNLQTVVRHFQWMEEYGIDGVELSRFVPGLDNPDHLDFKDKVAMNVRTGAEIHGRFFYIQYDISGYQGNSLVNDIKKDWGHLVDSLKLTDSSQYLHHRGLPVIGLYGFGFVGRPYTSDQAMELIDYFQSSAPAKYQATVKGGVPAYWRTGTRDSEAGPEWAQVYRSFDVISPWAVGRFWDNQSAGTFTREVTIPDMKETAALDIDYMPVMFPGFSWSNLKPGDPINAIPRNGGDFYWRQVYNAVSAKANMLYVAMFDEVDEGTAMFKLAATEEELPEGNSLVPLNIDGFDLPSDWYLILGGMTGQMLRGEIPLSPELPVQPKPIE